MLKASINLATESKNGNEGTWTAKQSICISYSNCAHLCNQYAHLLKQTRVIHFYNIYYSLSLLHRNPRLQSPSIPHNSALETAELHYLRPFCKEHRLCEHKAMLTVWRKKEPFLYPHPGSQAVTEPRKPHQFLPFRLQKISVTMELGRKSRNLSWADTQLFSHPSSSLLNSPEAGRY